MEGISIGIECRRMLRFRRRLRAIGTFALAGSSRAVRGIDGGRAANRFRLVVVIVLNQPGVYKVMHSTQKEASPY